MIMKRDPSKATTAIVNRRLTDDDLSDALERRPTAREIELLDAIDKALLYLDACCDPYPLMARAALRHVTTARGD